MITSTLLKDWLPMMASTVYERENRWPRARESNLGHIGGRRALSLPQQPCSPEYKFNVELPQGKERCLNRFNTLLDPPQQTKSTGSSFCKSTRIKLQNEDSC